MLHPRFAAGRALFRTDVARLAAAAFFTPGVTEVLHGLMDPTGSDDKGASKQPTQLWRVELQSSPLQAFGRDRLRVADLARHCASSGVIVLGLYRQHEDAEQSVYAEGSRGGDGPPAHPTPAAEAVSGGGKLPYTVTCPHPDTRLRPSDAIFALAPARGPQLMWQNAASL